MESYLYFNGTIRFLMEIFFDVAFVASMNLQTADWETPFPSEAMSNDLSVVFIVLVSICPVVLLLLTWCRTSLWTKEKFTNRCGAIFDDLDPKKLERQERVTLIWPMLFFFRRIAFIIVVLRYRETLIMQLAVQNSISLFIVIYLQWYKPLESRFANNIETFNEMTALALTYFLFCFTDFVPEPETRNDLGSYYNYVSFSNIGVHIVIMLSVSFSQVKLSCRKRYYAKKAKMAA